MIFRGVATEWTCLLQMGLEAATKALLDAGITYDKVEAAFCGVSKRCRGELGQTMNAHPVTISVRVRRQLYRSKGSVQLGHDRDTHHQCQQCKQLRSPFRAVGPHAHIQNCSTGST